MPCTKHQRIVLGKEDCLRKMHKLMAKNVGHHKLERK
jgi:hypothetical protein